MKKLMLTVIAGSLCAAFGTVYAQGTPGPSGAQATPSSKVGVETPKQTDDNRPDVGKGAAPKRAATAPPAPAAAPAPAPSADMSAPPPARKSRRAARREKG